MRRLTQTLPRRAAALAAAAVAVALLPTPTAQAAGPVVLDPRAFTRGADVAVPHVEGTTLVDGTLRVSVPAQRVTYLGRAGTGYVLGTSTRQGTRGRIVRVEADGTVGRLGKGDPFTSRLSTDGRSVLTTRGRFAAGKSDVTVRSALDGTVVATRTFPGYPQPLDAQGSTVLLSSYDRRGTRAWDLGTDAVTPVTRRPASLADYSLDLLVSVTDDPYDGGCTVVSRLSSPGTRLWRSCQETVRAFSTDGSRMATVDLLSDGLGAGRVWARTVTGTRLATYDAVRRGYVGEVRFESPTALLLEAAGPRKAAVVRCVGTTCDRASDLGPAPAYRLRG